MRSTRGRRQVQVSSEQRYAQVAWGQIVSTFRNPRSPLGLTYPLRLARTCTSECYVLFGQQMVERRSGRRHGRDCLLYLRRAADRPHLADGQMQLLNLRSAVPDAVTQWPGRRRQGRASGCGQPEPGPPRSARRILRPPLFIERLQQWVYRPGTGPPSPSRPLLQPAHQLVTVCARPSRRAARSSLRTSPRRIPPGGPDRHVPRRVPARLPHYRSLACRATACFITHP